MRPVVAAGRERGGSALRFVTGMFAGREHGAIPAGADGVAGNKLLIIFFPLRRPAPAIQATAISGVIIVGYGFFLIYRADK